MSSNMKSLIFAAVMCVSCSLLLTLASSGLKDIQERNVVLDKHKNILRAAGLIQEDKSYTPAEYESLYQKNIKSVLVDDAGRLIPEENARQSKGKRFLPVYLYSKKDVIEAYIIPIDTRGLWGKIKGYLAIESDGSTIRGFTVYKHSETPGLGGEIEKKWFEKNFQGKKIVNTQGQFVSIHIAKGPVDNRIPQGKRINYVDGISGATLTGKYLTAGLKTILSDYEPVAIRFRQENKAHQPATINNVDNM